VSVLASLACRIAVSNGTPGTGGFVTFPGGQFAADKASDVDLPGQIGYSGLSYSAAVQKWLPVSRDWVTPDGKRYVYWNWQQGSLMIVDAAHGSQTTISGTGSSTGGWSIFDAEQSTVYLSNQSYPAGEGLWIGHYSGGVQQITSAGYWQAVNAGIAYGTETSSVPQGAANTIQRFDSTAKSKQNWFSEPGLQGIVEGFAVDGSPIVVASKPGGTVNGQQMTDQEVWLATGPAQARQLFQATFPSSGGGPYGPPAGVTSVLGDSHGVWISVQNQGLYLWSDAAGLEHASAVSGQLGSGCD